MRIIFYFGLLFLLTGVNTAQKEKLHRGIEEDEDYSSCEYENPTATLGLGLVILPDEFILYEDSALTKVFCERIMFNEVNVRPEICAKFCKPEYSIMHLVCVNMNENSYSVLIDSSTVAYAPRNDQYTFNQWGEYITSSLGIRRKPEFMKDNPLKPEPTSKGKSISLPKGNESLCAMEVKGDWVKVKYDCFQTKDNNEYLGEPCVLYISLCETQVGWIKWRDEETLLIDLFLIP